MQIYYNIIFDQVNPNISNSCATLYQAKAGVKWNYNGSRIWDRIIQNS